jgi:glutamine synthetase
MSIDRDPQDLDLATRAQIDGVSFLLALFVDLTGKPCAKLVPVEAAEALQRDGVGFAGFAVGAIGQRPDDPDLIAIPDPASYTPLPWIRADLALVLTLEAQTLTRACGKAHLRNLEPEDLVALTVEAAAMARVPLAGTTWIPGT